MNHRMKATHIGTSAREREPGAGLAPRRRLGRVTRGNPSSRVRENTRH
jgi:hypothetical protein